MRKLLRSKKALSPVIAAIILIAVTVAVSIAVAAWMGALTFSFTQNEQLTYTAYTWGASNAYFNMTVKNIGSSDLTIASIKVDGNSVTPNAPTLPYLLTKGTSVTVKVTSTFNSGVGYNFIVVTAKGNQFPYTQTAP